MIALPVTWYKYRKTVVLKALDSDANPHAESTKPRQTQALWAQPIIATELRLEVVLHDDNSAESMFDRSVGPLDALEIEIEVVRAVDQESGPRSGMLGRRGRPTLGCVGRLDDLD